MTDLYLRDTIGGRIYVGDGKTYTVANVRICEDIMSLRIKIEYECRDDDWKLAGRFIVRTRARDMRIEATEWYPENAEWEMRETEYVFDASSVSRFLEGIEVKAD